MKTSETKLRMRSRRWRNRKCPESATTLSTARPKILAGKFRRQEFPGGISISLVGSLVNSVQDKKKSFVRSPGRRRHIHEKPVYPKGLARFLQLFPNRSRLQKSLHRLDDFGTVEQRIGDKNGALRFFGRPISPPAAAVVVSGKPDDQVIGAALSTKSELPQGTSSSWRFAWIFSTALPCHRAATAGRICAFCACNAQICAVVPESSDWRIEAGVACTCRKYVTWFAKIF